MLALLVGGILCSRRAARPRLCHRPDLEARAAGLPGGHRGDGDRHPAPEAARHSRSLPTASWRPCASWRGHSTRLIRLRSRSAPAAWPRSSCVRRTAPGVPGVFIAVAGATAARRRARPGRRGRRGGPAAPGTAAPHRAQPSPPRTGKVDPSAVAVALVAFADTSVLSRSYARSCGRASTRIRSFSRWARRTSRPGCSRASRSRAARRGRPWPRRGRAHPAHRRRRRGRTGDRARGWRRADENLPHAALGAVVIAAVIGLVDVPALRWLARVNRVGLRPRDRRVRRRGAVRGAARDRRSRSGSRARLPVARVAPLRRGARPGDGRKGYHDVVRHPDAATVPGLVLYRFDAPLFFANAGVFQERTAARGGGGSAAGAQGRHRGRADHRCRHDRGGHADRAVPRAQGGWRRACLRGDEGAGQGQAEGIRAAAPDRRAAVLLDGRRRRPRLRGGARRGVDATGRISTGKHLASRPRPDRAAAEDEPHALRKITSTVRSASASVVDQLLTLMRIAAAPCQRRAAQPCGAIVLDARDDLARCSSLVVVSRSGRGPG